MDPQGQSALSLLWRKQTLEDMSANISPRLARLVSKVAQLLPHPNTGKFTEQELKELEEEFRAIDYTRHMGSGPICRINDPKLKCTPPLHSDYRCFTCEIVRGSVVCERCFSDPKHAGHEFKVLTGGQFLCDCGNDEWMRRDCFCREHWDDRETQSRRAEQSGCVGRREGELFSKEMEFLLCMGVLSKLSCEEG